MSEERKFVGRWIAWKDNCRFEQELYEDGKLEALVFDEDDTICHAVIGTWKVDGDTVYWRYTKGGPKGVDKDKIVFFDAGRFSVQDRNGVRTDFYRGIKGSAETSTNFDLKELRLFLKRLSVMVKSGFGTEEISRFVKDIKRLKHEQSRQYVFPITFEGSSALLGIRVFMDDVDAPDVYFYAPLKLVRQIDKEVEKLDAGFEEL